MANLSAETKHDPRCDRFRHSDGNCSCGALSSKDVVARLVELLDAIDDAIEQGAPQLGGFDFSVLSAAHEEIVQLQRKVKCYEPTNTYDGLDIDQWRQRALAAERAVPETSWRCFHCDEVFTERATALEHFGSSLICDPACKIDIAEYRRMEENNRRHCEEDTELHRALHAKDSEMHTAVRRAEEDGYAKGLKDARAELKTNKCLCTPLAQQHLASFGTIAVTVHPDCPLHASPRTAEPACPACGPTDKPCEHVPTGGDFL